MSRSRAAFTLIEMLVVLAIVAVFFGLGASVLDRRDARQAAVRGAADELASVFRATRAKAMERHATYAVVFNIQNTPDRSGIQLSNGGGGHWYRVLGPTVSQVDWRNLPPYFDSQTSLRDNSAKSTGSGTLWTQALRPFEEMVARSWVGDRHVLTPGRVRFVALTDQDNGDYCMPGNTYAPTYPRPWFGWYDATTKRLRPWGGYDPALPKQAAQTWPASPTHGFFRALSNGGHAFSHSGFFYEGEDDRVVGSRNPLDRIVYEDGDDDTWLHTAYESVGYPMCRAGEPRPLINAGWCDYALWFMPDGSVRADWMRLRHEMAGVNTDGNFSSVYPVTGGRVDNRFIGPSDRSSRVPMSMIEEDGTAYPEASGYIARTGCHFITLGPDLRDDTDTYPDAATALRAIMPLYRVAVGSNGHVRVLPVSSSPRGPMIFDTTIAGSDWEVKAKTDRYFAGLVVTNVDLPASDPDRLPRPVEDVVTDEMMLKRQWWTKVGP